MGPCELHLVVHYIQYIHATYICVMYLGAYFRTFAVLGSARIHFGAPSNSLPVTFLQRSLYYNPRTQLLKHFKSKTLRSEFFPCFGECPWRRAQSCWFSSIPNLLGQSAKIKGSYYGQHSPFGQTVSAVWALVLGCFMAVPVTAPGGGGPVSGAGLRRTAAVRGSWLAGAAAASAGPRLGTS